MGKRLFSQAAGTRSLHKGAEGQRSPIYVIRTTKETGLEYSIDMLRVHDSGYRCTKVSGSLK